MVIIRKYFCYYISKYLHENCAWCINKKDNAFNSCSFLAEVVIPESVIEIQENAFYNCGRLKEIIIPNPKAKINFLSFRNCIVKDKNNNLIKFSYEDLYMACSLI